MVASARFWGLSALCLLSVVACSKPTLKTANYAGADQLASPLGPSYLLMPLPADDDALVGRILRQAPSPGQAIEEISAANPCEAELEPAKTFETPATFEDAIELRLGASGRAVLGGFGFAADATTASHLVYRLDTTRKISRKDKVTYAECCKARGCGYGYVSALVFGRGQYASAEETSGSARADFAVAGASGQVGLRVLHKRAVQGGVAAIIVVHEAAKEPLNALGLPASSGIEETSVSAAVKEIYEANKITVSKEGWLSDGKGKVGEREFARRYREVTGSDELDPLDYHRHRGMAIGGLTMFALGLPLAIYAIPRAVEDCTPNRDGCDSSGSRIANGGYFALGILGGGAAGAGLLVGVLGLAISDDGQDLSDRETRLYADRYNRVLLRRTVRDVQRNQTSRVSPSFTMRLSPLVSQSTLGLGVFGAF